MWKVISTLTYAKMLVRFLPLGHSLKRYRFTKRAEAMSTGLFEQAL